jgi:hypothetical protein
MKWYCVSHFSTAYTKTQDNQNKKQMDDDVRDIIASGNCCTRVVIHTDVFTSETFTFLYGKGGRDGCNTHHGWIFHRACIRAYLWAGKQIRGYF